LDADGPTAPSLTSLVFGSSFVAAMYGFLGWRLFDMFVCVCVIQELYKVYQRPGINHKLDAEVRKTLNSNQTSKYNSRPL
jgi:hypothetical protein